MYSCKDHINGEIVEVRKKVTFVDKVTSLNKKERFLSTKIGERAKAYLLSHFNDVLNYTDDVYVDDGWYYFKMWRVTNIKDLIPLFIFSKPDLISIVKEPTIELCWLALNNSISYRRIVRVSRYIKSLYDSSEEISDTHILFKSHIDEKMIYKKIKN
jgi:hypothetical protein